MRKGLILPLILLMLLALAFLGGIYFWKATSNSSSTQTQPSNSGVSTANWKTFEGKIIKVSLKAPPNWNVSEQKGFEQNAATASAQISVNGPANKGFWIIEKPQSSLAGLTQVSAKDITIDGTTVKKVYYAVGDDATVKPTTFVVILPDPKKLIMIVGNLDTTTPGFDKTVDTILETLKFKN